MKTKEIRYFKLQKKLYFSLLIPFILSGIILYLSYPGFMSYDSIRMLEEARSSVIGGIFPAMPVYILRFFDIYGHGVSTMLFIQNFLLLSSFSLIMNGYNFKVSTQIYSLIFLLIGMPLVIGCMLVLWKDVTMTSLLLFSLSMIYLIDLKKVPLKYYSLIKWITFFSLSLATLVRFNAFFSTIVAFFYWVSIFYPKFNAIKKLLLIIIIAFYFVIINNIINGYRFPSLERLEPNTNAESFMSYDILGISGWSRVPMIPIDSRLSKDVAKANISEIDNVYSSLGLVIISQNINSRPNKLKIFPEKYDRADIFKAWINAVIDHPKSYLRYRWDLFSEIIGAKPYETYEPTHFGKIDENSFDIKFKENRLTNILLDYIKFTSGTFVGKPWFIFIMTIIFYPFFLMNRENNKKDIFFVNIIAVIAILYICPLYFMVGTGEVRYAFPSTVICMELLTIFFVTYFMRKKEG